MATPYVTIAGPVGAGKSTFAGALCEATGWQLFLESAADNNPFLADFYSDRSRYALPSQTFFTLEAARQQRLISELEGGAVQDRSIWEHLGIFGRAMRDEGALSGREYELLSEIAGLSAAGLPDPDLLVVINGSGAALRERIVGRGRDYELVLDVAELDRMSARYRDWTSNWKRSPILELELMSGPRPMREGARKVLSALNLS